MSTMTASILPACARGSERLLRACAVLALLVPLIFGHTAHASEARIVRAEIVRGDVGYVLNADIDVELNPRLADAVRRGVSLYFTTELRIERPRWYWLNELVVDRGLVPAELVEGEGRALGPELLEGHLVGALQELGPQLASQAKATLRPRRRNGRVPIQSA